MSFISSQVVESWSKVYAKKKRACWKWTDLNLGVNGKNMTLKAPSSDLPSFNFKFLFLNLETFESCKLDTHLIMVSIKFSETRFSK